MLLRLTWRGRLRRAWRGLRAPRGAILSLIGLIVTASWFGPSVWLARTRPVPDPDVVASVAASALLLILCSIALMPATAPGRARGARGWSPAGADADLMAELRG